MKTILLAGLAVSTAVAQTLTEPPALLRLHRRPGAASARPYAEARIPVNVMGMEAIPGPPETWLMEVHESFASIENFDNSLGRLASFGATDAPDQAGEILAGSKSLIASYRPRFSYLPEQAIQALGKARRCEVTIYRVAGDSEAQFAELVRSRRIMFSSINLDRPDIAYYIVSGAASGTYMFLAPLTSLKVLDEALAKVPAHAESSVAEAAKAGGVAREHLLFWIDPATRWVSDDFASAPPEFWRGKAKTP